MVRFKVAAPSSTVFDPEQNFPPLADWPPAAPIAEDGTSLRFEDRNPATIHHTRTETESPGLASRPTATLERANPVEAPVTQDNQPLDEELAVTSPPSTESPFEASPWVDQDRSSSSRVLDTPQPSSFDSNFNSNTDNSAESTSPSTSLESAPFPREDAAPSVPEIAPTPAERSAAPPIIILDRAPSPENQSSSSFKFDTSQTPSSRSMPESVNLSEQSNNSQSTNLLAPL